MDDLLSGSVLISAETTHESFSDDSLPVFVKEHFTAFLGYLKFLTDDERDMLLSSYVLGATQHQLGAILGFTQTVTSQRIRLASKALGCFIQFGGHPSQAHMEAILTGAGQEPTTALWVKMYRECWSFKVVADKLRIHRPAIKRGISAVSKTLLESKEPLPCGLGAYFATMIVDKSAVGVGKSKAARRKGTRIERKDPDELGSFRINISADGFDKMFMSKSTLYHDEED